MKIRTVTVVCVLALVAMLLPVLLVSAAPPGRPVYAILGPVCEVWFTFRESGNAIHYRSEQYREFISSDPDVAGVQRIFIEPGCNGFPLASPCKGSGRLVPGATMKTDGSCAADGMNSPDYWEGPFTWNATTSAHNRLKGVAKGFGRFRGLEMRVELLLTEPEQMVGWIIETGGYGR